MLFFFFFFNDTATTEIYTLSLHDALPIYRRGGGRRGGIASAVDLPCLARLDVRRHAAPRARRVRARARAAPARNFLRSEEHTSELQSRPYLVCRLLLEKKNKSRSRPATRS